MNFENMNYSFKKENKIEAKNLASNFKRQWEK